MTSAACRYASGQGPAGRKVSFPSGRGDLNQRDGWVVGDKRRRFDPEFREGAKRIVKETGKPVAQVARGLEINPYTLHNWMKADRVREAASEALSESEREELARRH